MSRHGNPYDNAKAESFMATLKREQIDGRRYRDLAEAQADIGHFIDILYNAQRLHSALGYRSPQDFEAWHRAGPPQGADGAARSLGLRAARAPDESDPGGWFNTMQIVSP
jgi:putative transposase